MKYDVRSETTLLTELLDPALADDPLAFVMFVYPWGKADTPLQHESGPRVWQRDYLESVRDFIQAQQVAPLQDLPYLIYRHATASGRGPGKSALVAWLVHWMMTTRIGSTTVITANTEAQLRTRTWAEVRKWQTLAFNGHWFEPTALKLAPSKWFADTVKDRLSIDVGYYYAQAQIWSEENPDAFAGIHNPHGLNLIYDEASGIPKPIWTVSEGFFTDPTPDRFWHVFSNPRRNEGEFFNCFTQHAEFWKLTKIDSRDVEGTDKAMLDRMIQQHGADSDIVRVEVKGLFPKSDADTVIALHLVHDAVDRRVTADEKIRPLWGLDVARYGGDENVLLKRQGNNVSSVQAWSGVDLMQTVGRVKAEYDNAHTYAKPEYILVDSIGLGAGVVDRLRQLELPVVGVNVSESPSFKGKHYLNLRAELWFAAAQWFVERNGSIPDDPEMSRQLCSPTYSYTESGKLKVESKEKMRKRGVASPDRAEAFILTFAKEATTAIYGLPNSHRSTKEPIRRRLSRLC